MSDRTSKKRNGKGNISHVTNIQGVTGQVHTGSGDIHIGSFFVTNQVTSRTEFLAALREFKREVVNARNKELSEAVADEVILEVEAVEKEINLTNPRSNQIAERLIKAKSILVAAAGAAGAATLTINKFLSVVDTAIQFVSKIFK